LTRQCLRAGYSREQFLAESAETWDKIAQ
jgi:hypothetical protein